MVNLREARVSDVMSKPDCVSGDTSIAEAIGLIRTGREFLSVVDDEGRLIGSVSENNLIRIAKHQPPGMMGDPVWFDELDQGFGRQPVSSIMTTTMVTISQGDDLATALRVMSSSGYRLISVVDKDYRLLGVLRMRDIFRRILGD